MTEMQNTVRAVAHRLTDTIDELKTEIGLKEEQIQPLMHQLQVTGYFIWKISLFTSISVLGISMVLSVALLLGIIHAERAAKVTFVIGALLITMGSCGLAIFTIIFLLAGSHGEVFLCRPLYGAPNYQMFTNLFDKPGWVYDNETINGIVNDLFYTPTIDETKSLNISLATALQKCERNEASYEVFQFDRIANASELLEIHEYTKLEEEIEVSWKWILCFGFASQTNCVLFFSFFYLCFRAFLCPPHHLQH